MACLAWSFTALYTGKTPKKDFTGKALDGPRGKPLRRGILYAITGDLEFFASEFGWPYSNSNSLCPFCSADQQKIGSTTPYTDMRPCAAWRSTVLTASQLEKKYKHKLFSIPGVSILTLKLDVLHLLDLGVSCYLYGSVFYSIMEKLGGTRKEAQLVSLNRLLVRLWEGQNAPAGKRMRSLHLSDLAKSSEEYPVLKHVKAAKVRWLSPVMVELCSYYKEERSEKHRLEAVQALDSMYKSLKVPWKNWQAEACKTFSTEIEKLLAHYSWLAKDSLQAGKHLYSMTQKHHILCHLASQSDHLHPCTFWCYGSESFMSIMVHMASSCTRGTPPHKVGLKVVQKFRLVFHLLLAKHFDLEAEDGSSSSE